MNEEIEQLIARHESFKQKWLMLTNDDLFEWIKLQDEMIDLASKLESIYTEKKLRMDADKWKRHIELKLELDENGKKVHTDSTASSQIDNEYLDEDIEQSVRKIQYKLLNEK